MSSEYELKLSTILTSLVFFARSGIQLFSFLIISQLLGATDFALFTGICATALLLGAFSSLGLNMQLMKETSDSGILIQKEILSYAIPCTVLCGAILLAAYLAIVFLCYDRIKFDALSIFALGASEIILSPLILLIATTQHAQKKIVTTQIILAGPLAVRLIVVFFIYIQKPENTLQLLSLSILTISILFLLLLWRLYEEQLPKPSNFRLPQQKTLRENYPFAIINLASLSSTELDKALALSTLSHHQAGIYMATSRTLGAIALPMIALMSSATPILFKKKTSKKELAKKIFFVGFIYSLIATGIILLACKQIESFFGSSYEGLSESLQWSSLIVIGMTLRSCAGSMMIPLNLIRQRFTLEIIVTILIATLFIRLEESNQLRNIIYGLASIEMIGGLLGWYIIYKKIN